MYARAIALVNAHITNKCVKLGVKVTIDTCINGIFIVTLQKLFIYDNLIMATQSEDFKWFVKNHDKLYKLYPNKSLVIQDKKIVCDGSSFEDALTKAISKGLEVGTFIIQECTEGEASYTQSFSSRVVFA